MVSDSEAVVEARLIARVEAAGGMCMKFTSPGMSGVSDRIVVLPGAQVFFIELKRLKGRTRSLQTLWADEMLARDVIVAKLYSVAEVDAWIEAVCP